MLFRLLFGMQKNYHKSFYRRITCLCFLFSILGLATNAQNELPSAVTAQIQSIKSGSLIIPMDTLLQNKPGYFNLKAYGLINALLQNEIPVKWAIRKGKSKNNAASIDFSTASSGVTRIFPDTQVISSVVNYYSGPFIIDSSWVSAALPIIKLYANNVVIHKLAAATSIDIRYNLTFKPYIGLLNCNGYDTVTVHELQEAGFNAGSYKLFLPIGQIYNETTPYSLLSESHYTGGDTTHVNPVLRYVQRGGNLISHCTSIGAYENRSLILTTGGVDSSAVTGTNTYSNSDLPIAQFQGTLFNPWGEYKWWRLKPTTGNALRSYSYDVLSRPSSSTARLVTAAKIIPPAEKGGNIYYLCSHDFYFYTVVPFTPNDHAKINGRRITINSVFVPPSDTFGFDFRTDIKLKMTACSIPVLPVKNENFTFIIIASNAGYRAKNVKVNIPFIPALSYSSHTTASGIYNSLTGVWSIDSLMKGATDTLFLTTTINSIGTIKFPGSITSSSYEEVNLNNVDTVTIFGVSRPVALNDTINFNGGYFVDAPTKINDTDEDGGPFGNTTIINGPFNGAASVINGDTIRYVPTAAYTGPDSLLYLTCDNYPLCDTAWLIINVNTPLPVELSEFSGVRKNGSVKLKWTTLSESGNEHFNIQRSIDGRHFEARGQIKGAGTTSMINYYDFKEIDPGFQFLYYRLQQVDYNGKFEFSPVIALPLRSANHLSLSLYPNPVDKDHELAIHIEGISKGHDMLRISDITGRIILEKRFELDNEGSMDQFLQTTDYLESGCYIVTLITDNETIGKKLVVK